MCTTNVGRIYFHTIIAAVCNYAKMCIGRNRSKCAFCPRLVYNLIVYVAFLGIVEHLRVAFHIQGYMFAILEKSFVMELKFFV